MNMLIACGSNCRQITEVSALVDNCVMSVGVTDRACYSAYHGPIPSPEHADAVRQLAVALAGVEELY